MTARVDLHDQAVRLAAERRDRAPDRGSSFQAALFTVAVVGLVALTLWWFWPQRNGGLPPTTAMTSFTGGEQAPSDEVAAGDTVPTQSARRDLADYAVPFSEIARIMAQPALVNDFPNQLNLVDGEQKRVVDVQYGFDPELQSTTDEILAHYKPDYGVFFAMRPDTGQVLAMSSFSKVAPSMGNLAIRASYPAASVFKIVTAAAAIESAKLSAETVIPYNGKSTALYKKHVLRHADTKWTRRPTMRQAFGKSVNPVFGRLGVFDVGGETLNNYAERFGFNRTITSDLPFEDSRSTVDVADDWEVVEMAAGYTRRNKMSPVHGAMIAGSVINEGVMMQPYLVTGVVDADNQPLYRPQLAVAGQPMLSDTADEMRKLMRETIISGSARKSFRGFFKGKFSEAEVGGKTGSLTGSDPKGRNEWFVGYGILGERKIAFAALTVNIDKWTVKPAYVARKALESYLSGSTEIGTAAAYEPAAGSSG